MALVLACLYNDNNENITSILKNVKFAFVVDSRSGYKTCMFKLQSV